MSRITCPNCSHCNRQETAAIRLQLTIFGSEVESLSIFSAVMSAGKGGHEVIVRLLLQWKDANLKLFRWDSQVEYLRRAAYGV